MNMLTTPNQNQTVSSMSKIICNTKKTGKENTWMMNSGTEPSFLN